MGISRQQYKLGLIGFSLALSFLVTGRAGESQAQPAAGAGNSAQQELQDARAKVRNNPVDAKARFALGEALRKLGRNKEAAQEYLAATEFDPGMYVAYHQLSLSKASNEQLDTAIERLQKLKEEKSKDLMLRVALSELMEKRGSFSQAARVLVELVYQNAVDLKYQAKVNARIHYLLAQAKHAHVNEANLSQSGVGQEESQLDTLPPAPPDLDSTGDLSSAKIKDARVMPAVGNTPLLP